MLVIVSTCYRRHEHPSRSTTDSLRADTPAKGIARHTTMTLRISRFLLGGSKVATITVR